MDWSDVEGKVVYVPGVHCTASRVGEAERAFAKSFRPDSDHVIPLATSGALLVVPDDGEVPGMPPFMAHQHVLLSEAVALSQAGEPARVTLMVQVLYVVKKKEKKRKEGKKRQDKRN